MDFFFYDLMDYLNFDDNNINKYCEMKELSLLGCFQDSKSL